MNGLPNGYAAFEFEFESLSVRGLQGGSGPVLVLLHGSGPGASSLGNWRSVLTPLSEHFRVIAMDLIGFGASDRRDASPYFDMAMWQRQIIALFEYLRLDSVDVLAHSIAAPLAFRVAARGNAIRRIVATGAMGAPFPVTDALHRVWRCPRDERALLATGRTLVADGSRIDEAWIKQRWAVVGAPGYADYFDAMFEGPLERFIESSVLGEHELQAVQVPVLLLHGLHDEAFPWEPLSGALVHRLPRADLMLLRNCNHSVALERGDALLAACRMHFLD